MPEWTPLIAVDRVPAGKTVLVYVKEQYYVVCADGGRFHVADCVCPHAGGPLGGADVRDGCIICPVHHWPWDVRTGLSDPQIPEFRLSVYPCEVRDGVVVAQLSAAPLRDPDLDCRNDSDGITSA